MAERKPDRAEMDERGEREYFEEDMIDLGGYFRILRASFWKITGISLAVGILTLLYMFTKPNLYRSTAVIMPPAEDSKQSPSLGALASLGLSVGGPTKVEDLEVLFKSKDLAVRVFDKAKPWAYLLGDRYDPATGVIKPTWFSGLFRGKKDPEPPGEWDAIRAAEDVLTVSLNRKTGSLTLAFESISQKGSAEALNRFLEEAKSRLQEEAFDRARKNKQFIEEQIGKTVDPLTRDRLYALLGQEVEREMMARNREQFGFRVIDSPRVPDRKSGPARVKSAAVATILSFSIWCIIVIARGKKQTTGVDQ